MKKDKKQQKKQLFFRPREVCVFLIQPNGLYLPLFEQKA